jgi:phosphatidylethanolamine-binding protein (PEBP) family uncharacterized protein
MEVFFGQRKVRNNEVISIDQAQETFKLNFEGDPNKLYTILFYDPDAPVGPYVHYEVQNAPGGDISRGDVTFSYVSPNPPPQTGVHRYTLIVFEQKRTLPGGLNTGGRAPIPLEAYMKSLELTPIEQHVIQIPSPGSFVGPMTRARRRIQAKFNGYSNEKNWVDQQALPNKNDRAYCRCILHVAANQPSACNQDRAWFETRKGEKCFNPYAVCHESVKGESGQPECGDNYLFDQIPDQELVGYAGLNRIEIPYPYNREEMLANIKQWKKQIYE